ncbi:MAG: hypothetical protein ACK4N5_25980 [Myxococcales bacterium]
MSRPLLLVALALALAGCGGDPAVEELRAFLTGELPVSDASALDSLNRTFAAQAVRAHALRREVGADLGEEGWSPVQRGVDPADVSPWRDEVIDPDGAFAPAKPSSGAPQPPDVGLPAAEGERRAALLFGALHDLAPELQRLQWNPALTVGIQLADDGRTAVANPRVLLLVPPAASLALVTDEQRAAAIPVLQPAVPRPLERSDAAASASGFHDSIKTGVRCLDILFLVMLAPAWILWHVREACGSPFCSVAPLAAPSPWLALGLLPSAIAWALGRRRASK